MAFAAKAKLTTGSLMDQAETILTRAMESGQLSAAFSTPKEKGVLSGKRIERAEIGGPGEFDHLSDAERERLLVERLAQLGFAPVPAISNDGAETDIRKDHDY